MDKLLYGVAYYDEYMPEDRLQEDIRLMQQAGINVIRIAESTWSSEEPENGVFDFSHVERVLQATEQSGISVLVGTPTYAIPPWLAAEHPEVLAVTEKGPGKYGARQIMDITSPAYLYHAERVIRKLVECVQKYPHVIGFQLDNETKHYNTAGPNVLKQFTRYLRAKFGTLEELNRAFGFSYWSNRVDAWENLPDPTGSINGSYRAEFEKFRRGLVTEFLSWQSRIVREYLRPEQFITHNFDFAWRGYSYGVQPAVDHKKAAACLDIAGCDIYHPTQSRLTGKEIAFGGDLTRGLKAGGQAQASTGGQSLSDGTQALGFNGQNYLVLETEAQGHINWTPYDGQLRLHAFSHVASGASAVMYWHWHSIHNSFETYWKGLLSHDLQPNRAYREAKTIGADFARLSPTLTGLRKQNQTALLVSNEALTGMAQFPLPSGFPFGAPRTDYNDIVRLYYDALYEQNLECDILFPEDIARLSEYKLLVVPALYSAPDTTLAAISAFVEQGGHLITTFRSGFSDENLTVRHTEQPAGLSACCGIRYDEFTEPADVALRSDVFEVAAADREASLFMELVDARGATVLAHYEHPFWGSYAAVTENHFGSGMATYVACLTTPAYTRAIVQRAADAAGLWGAEQKAAFPLVIRNAVSAGGVPLHFYFNYSGEPARQPYLHGAGRELLAERPVAEGEILDLEPWGFAVIAEE